MKWSRRDFTGLTGERMLNDPTKKSRSPLIVEQSGYPMERVAIDIIGPLPNTINRNRYILESLSKRRFCQHGRQPEVNRTVTDGA